MRIDSLNEERIPGNIFDALKDHRESQKEMAFLLVCENIYQISKMSFSYMKYKSNYTYTHVNNEFMQHICLYYGSQSNLLFAHNR